MNLKKTILIVAIVKKIALVLALLFAAAPAANAAVKVVTTSTQLADVVHAIGGDKIELHSLLRAGMDPHDYKLVRSDTAQMLAADLVIAQGLGLEGKMTRAFEQVAARDAGKLLVVGDKLPKEKLIAVGVDEHDHDAHDHKDAHEHHDHDHANSVYDPHVWFDPTLWRNVAPIIADALVAKDAANAAFYRANAAAWQAQLDATYVSLKAQMLQVPAQSRVLITAHEAFAYFGRAFDIQVLGIQGVSTENEAGLKHISQLVELIANRKIKAVFAEQSVPARSVQALIEGARREGQDVVLGGKLYSDTLGVAGSGAETYVGMLTANVTTIAGALK